MRTNSHEDLHQKVWSAKDGHLKGSTGADSSRQLAASKHSAASSDDEAEPLSL